MAENFFERLFELAKPMLEYVFEQLLKDVIDDAQLKNVTNGMLANVYGLLVKKELAE